MHFIKKDEAPLYSSTTRKAALDAETCEKIANLADMFPENKELFTQFSKNLANHLFKEDLAVAHEFLIKFQFAVEEMREGRGYITQKPAPNEFSGKHPSFYNVIYLEGLEKIANSLLEKDTAKKVLNAFGFIQYKFLF